MTDNFNPSQEAVLASKVNSCVVAGAGSGKTKTLVEYLVRFLESGLGRPDAPSVTNILALTFTDKAAAEMRERLSRALREHLRAAVDSGANRPFWERQIRLLDQAMIGTIHSYALSLVRDHPHLLNLPHQAVVEESEALKSADLNEVLIDLLAEGQPDLMALLPVLPLRSANYGASLYKWLEVCVNRMASWGLSGLAADLEADREAHRVDLWPALQAFKDQSASVATRRERLGDDPKYDRTAEALRQLSDMAAAPVESMAARLPELLPQWQAIIDNIDGRKIREKSRLKENLAPLLEYCSNQLAIPVKTNLLNLVNMMPKRLKARRLARGAVNFDDILISARNLLRERAELRRREQEKYHLLVIDEFQDTNRLQADLLAQLLLEPGQDSLAWEALPWELLSPKIMVFGDPKQSIYRFRGAEPSIMLKLSDSLTRDRAAQALALDTNYRTQPRLIEFFNDFFAYYLPEDEKYEAQKASRPSKYDSKSVVWLTDGDGLFKKTNHLSKAGIQAGMVVDYLKRLFDPRTDIRVWDKDRNDIRRPAPGDVVLLMRRKKNAAVFEKALKEAGWPCHTLKGQNLFEAPEIRGLAAAYLFLLDYEPDLNLAACLSSPLGPVSEETLTSLVWPAAPAPEKRHLADYFQNEERPWPDSLDESQKKTLTGLRNLFLSLKPFVHRRPPGEILETLVEERHLLPLIIAGPDGDPERVKSVQRFLALVKTLPYHDPHHPESVADLLNDLWAEGHEAADSDGDGDENAQDDAGDDSDDPVKGAINIMTIHRAKGLEFPIVIIPEADAPPRSENPGLLLSDQGQLAVKFTVESTGLPIEPTDFKKIKEAEQAADLAEYRRLFYVAATRAMDHLVLVGWRPKDSNHSWLSQLVSWEGWAAHIRQDQPETRDRGVEVALKETQFISADQLNMTPPGAWPGQALIEPLPPSGYLTMPVTTYCHLAVGVEIKNGADVDRAEGEVDLYDYKSIGPPGPTPPNQRGTLFHSVMEKSDFNLAGNELKELVRQEANLLAIAASDREIDFIAEKILDFQNSRYGRELAGALAGGLPVFRELPFWLRLDKDEAGRGPIFLTGAIDLFYLTEDGQAQIVDYKLSKPTRQNIYLKQIDLYALAIKEAGFQGEIRADLWFAEPLDL
ncbi:MAG: UvrD-helicase domain-containing protein [Candidatus Adiutrix sp.]|jgi:ATP-dependent helicase/nuclease subunit A|nr:UvrD-helicase domain-containing protein [Candidatus Adiutrix sp.]